MNRNKYNASKTLAYGIVFDSKKEAQRYGELKLLEKAGQITALQRQVKFELLPRQKMLDGKYERPLTYIADFTYYKGNEQIVEDVKGSHFGAAYAIYAIKRKLMLYFYGIEIQEV